MSIQKKSLISTLKTAKKANVAGKVEADAKGGQVSSMRQVVPKAAFSAKTAVSSKKAFSAKAMNSNKAVY